MEKECLKIVDFEIQTLNKQTFLFKDPGSNSLNTFIFV